MLSHPVIKSLGCPTYVQSITLCGKFIHEFIHARYFGGTSQRLVDNVREQDTAKQKRDFVVGTHVLRVRTAMASESHQNQINPVFLAENLW